MPINLGTAAIDDVRLGTVQVDKVMLGTELVWQAFTPPNIGDPFMGGFYAGIIDSTQPGSIPTSDASQTGLRYALIDLGVASEVSKQYKKANTAAPAACQTVWDGLSATNAMISAGSAYPAAQHAASYSVPSDGASDPYVPAMWELLAAYWNLKPMTDNNYLSADTGSTFPGGTVEQGYDPVADPARPKFTATVPGQTNLAEFKTGGMQALEGEYWTATEYDNIQGWEFYSLSGLAGYLSPRGKSLSLGVRLFRRFPL